MTVSYVEILGSNGVDRPSLMLLRQTRDALAKYCELRWPVGRRKAVERAWGLTPDEARGVCEATASATTIDKVWKHPDGGWLVVLPVLAAVIGHSVDDFLANERRKHVALAQRHRSMVRDLRALAPDRADADRELVLRVAGDGRTYRSRVGAGTRTRSAPD